MATDTVSSLFPDRPIRPLPRRRLRERLSPDVAESIQYPPVPQSTTPLFYYPYGLKDEDSESNAQVSRDKVQDAPSQGPRRHGALDSDEDESGARRGVVSRPVPDLSGRGARLQTRTDLGRLPVPPQPSSATSSIDGYDSFENTNNKKKRKIPTAGETSLNGSHSIAEGAGGLSTVSAGEGQGDGSGPTSTPYYGSGSFASGSSGISGPGRGRFGRTRNGRSPLRALSDASSNWAGRNGKLRAAQWAPQTKGETAGIISAAIANAEKLPSQGQENVSLLQHQATKTSPASSQFTFTCDSQVPGTFAWPGSGSDPKSSLPMHQGSTLHASAYRHSQPTQTHAGSKMASGQFATDTGPPGAQDGVPRAGASQQSDAVQKKSKRRAKDYLIAANRRRERMREYNIQYPPKDEEIWICEFCEYELIFGYPPEALIRQYELKDQRLRQQEEERRRLLEKAKMRSRKSKKANKLPPKNSTLPEHSVQNRNLPHGGQHLPPMQASNSQGTQSEDYYEYDDEDDYGSESPPPGSEVRGEQEGPEGISTKPGGHPRRGVGGAGGGGGEIRTQGGV